MLNTPTGLLAWMTTWYVAGSIVDAALTLTSTAPASAITAIELGLKFTDKPEGDFVEKVSGPERFPLLNRFSVKLLFIPGATSLVSGLRVMSKVPAEETELLVLVVLEPPGVLVLVFSGRVFWGFLGKVTNVIAANITVTATRIGTMNFFILG